ncbi:MAG: 50S ribosomal protein L9 [Minisyncoccia bacterium]
MKVILLKDVKKIGRAHEEVEVADGHALNFLLPRKLAAAATPAAKREAELRMKQKKDQGGLEAKLLKQNIAELAEARIVIKAKANEKSHLYNAVGELEISKAVKEQARVDLPEEAIKLERPLKELGVFEVPVSAGETFGRFSITIEAE